MKKIKCIIAIVSVIAVLLTTSIPSFAFSENESRSVQNFFVEAQLLKGDGDGYRLDKTASRMEGIIILIRLMGKEADAQNMADLPCQFSDVPAWAKGYVNYAYAEDISKGISATRFGTNDLMTAQQFNTLLLRTIGYNDSNGDFSWNSAVMKAYELEILPVDLAVQYESKKEYTKKDLMETAFFYLEAQYKDGNITLISSLLDDGVISKDLADAYGLDANKWDSITTSLNEDEHFTLKVDGNNLSISGRTTDSKKNYIMSFIEDTKTSAEKTRRIESVDSDGDYEISLPVGSLLKGEYYVDLYSNYERYNYYTSFIHSSLVLKVADDGTYFLPSPVYGQNLRMYKGNEAEEQDGVMTLETRSDPQGADTIKKFAEELTKGYSSDYKKVQAIHNWIAENIYYDEDYADEKTNSTNIPSLSVLEDRYAVCSGYANLTKDLISACGIPCKQVFGFALGISKEDRWDEVDISEITPNHVWNEAYVDGRWMIIDTTWDSSNKYTGGEFTKGDGVSQLYFDATMQFFSNTHKSMDLEGY